MSTVFQVRDGYAPRRKTIPDVMVSVRYLTLDEVKQLPSNGHADIIANDGTLRRVKVTSVKTWKRDSSRVEIGVKYGMYEYASFTGPEAITRFVRRMAE